MWPSMEISPVRRAARTSRAEAAESGASDRGASARAAAATARAAMARRLDRMADHRAEIAERRARARIARKAGRDGVGDGGGKAPQALGTVAQLLEAAAPRMGERGPSERRFVQHAADAPHIRGRS